MNKINLHRTHRLLYRLAWLKAGFAIFLAVGVLFAREVIINTKTIPSNLFPAEVWGILWLMAGLTVATALIRQSFTMLRVGLVALTSIYAMFFTAALIGKLTGIVGSYSLFVSAVFLTKALICATLLTEPPINPSTAVKSSKDDQ